MAETFDFAEIGLSNRDKRVYETLVRQPGSSLRAIAAATSINRGSVYESIKELVEQGLVGSLEVGKQRRYNAAPPSAIIELLKERQAQAAAAQTSATKYAQQLIATKPTIEEAPTSIATFYEDHEGIASVLRDVLATCNGRNGNAYRVISTKRIRQFMYQNFPNFTQRRIADEISVRVIAIGTGGSTDDLSERRWIEATRGDAPNCYTIIYGTKTAFITLSDTNVLQAIVIESAGISHAQKELFDHLWEQL